MQVLQIHIGRCTGCISHDKLVPDCVMAPLPPIPGHPLWRFPIRQEPLVRLPLDGIIG